MCNKEKVKEFLKIPEFKFWLVAVLLVILVFMQSYCFLKVVKIQRFFNTKLENTFDILKFQDRDRDLREFKKYRDTKNKIVKEIEIAFDEELEKLKKEEKQIEISLKKNKNFGKNFDRELENQVEIEMRTQRDANMRREKKPSQDNNNNDKQPFEQRREQRRSFIFRPKSEYKEDTKEYVVEFRVPENLKLEDVKVDFIANTLAINIEKSQSADGELSYRAFMRVFRTPETKATRDNVDVALKDKKVTIVVPIK
jgi:hypothetical protein